MDSLGGLQSIDVEDNSGMKMILKQGDLENIILNALWDLESEEHPKIFVGNIQEKIKMGRTDSKEWAYTTVKTVLDRLVDKEIALRERDGKKYLYRSVLKRDEAGTLALTKLIRQYFRNDMAHLENCVKKMRTNWDASKSFSTRPAAAERKSELVTSY
jgi:BlaI family transcriptional regulator, penicillinase repressor